MKNYQHAAPLMLSHERIDGYKLLQGNQWVSRLPSCQYRQIHIPHCKCGPCEYRCDFYAKTINWFADCSQCEIPTQDKTMPTKPTVVSYWIPGHPSEVQVKTMVASAESFGFKTHLFQYAVASVGVLPQLVSDAVERFRGQTVLLVLPDQHFAKDPALILSYANDRDVDFAAMLTEGKYGREQRAYSPAVVLLHCGDRAESFVDFYSAMAPSKRHLPVTTVFNLAVSRIHFNTKVISQGVVVPQPNNAVAYGPHTKAPIGCRALTNGNIIVLRHNAMLEQKLALTHTKISDREWKPRVFLPELQGIFQGCHLAIVGKGPSLDDLEAAELNAYDAIIGVNEAAKIVRLRCEMPVYCVQQDYKLKDTCLAPGVQMVANVAAAGMMPAKPGFMPVLTFSPKYWGLDDKCLSAEVAIHLAKHMGATKVDMLAFDACTNGATTYAKSIPYDAGDGSRFVRFKVTLEKALATLELPHTWR